MQKRLKILYCKTECVNLLTNSDSYLNDQVQEHIVLVHFPSKTALLKRNRNGNEFSNTCTKPPIFMKHFFHILFSQLVLIPIIMQANDQ